MIDGNARFIVREDYKNLQRKVLSFEEFLTNDGGYEGLGVLDEETRGLLEEYAEIIKNDMLILAEDLCYDCELLEENDLAE